MHACASGPHGVSGGLSAGIGQVICPFELPDVLTCCFVWCRSCSFAAGRGSFELLEQPEGPVLYKAGVSTCPARPPWLLRCLSPHRILFCCYRSNKVRSLVQRCTFNLKKKWCGRSPLSACCVTELWFVQRCKVGRWQDGGEVHPY